MIGFELARMLNLAFKGLGVRSECQRCDGKGLVAPNPIGGDGWGMNLKPCPACCGHHIPPRTWRFTVDPTREVSELGGEG